MSLRSLAFTYQILSISGIEIVITVGIGGVATTKLIEVPVVWWKNFGCGCDAGVNMQLQKPSKLC